MDIYLRSTRALLADTSATVARAEDANGDASAGGSARNRRASAARSILNVSVSVSVWS